MNGVQEMLLRLSSRYPLAVITTRGEHATRCFLDEHGLEPYFQVVVTGLTCRHTKPFPDPLLYAAEKIGVPPGSCLMVGDTSVDIAIGRAAGAQTAGVLCGFGEEAELRRKGADLILPCTADLEWVFVDNVGYAKAPDIAEARQMPPPLD
jgi:phosphoglycolate phosphatase-like HAD superfamily hydrolase